MFYNVLYTHDYCRWILNLLKPSDGLFWLFCVALQVKPMESAPDSSDVVESTPEEAQPQDVATKNRWNRRENVATQRSSRWVRSGAGSWIMWNQSSLPLKKCSVSPPEGQKNFKAI